MHTRASCASSPGAASPDAAGQLPPLGATEIAAPVPETSVFSPSLRFEGKVVEQLTTGRSVREVAYLRGRKVMVSTANGTVSGYLVNFARIRIGEIAVADVLGVVHESNVLSKDVDMLLGNSFLQHVQMRRTGDTMVITKSKGM